uniref:Uncharacterized protein n=1 Tax=Trichuris muris TaxID=70415 RepID=A0A5S6R426_TRIMR
MGIPKDERNEHAYRTENRSHRCATPKRDWSCQVIAYVDKRAHRRQAIPRRNALRNARSRIASRWWTLSHSSPRMDSRCFVTKLNGQHFTDVKKEINFMHRLRPVGSGSVTAISGEETNRLLDGQGRILALLW